MRGPRKIKLKGVRDVNIEQATDALIWITALTSAHLICSMKDKASAEEGIVLVHENLREVVEAGPTVVKTKKGDRVCVPFKPQPGLL